MGKLLLTLVFTILGISCYTQNHHNIDSLQNEIGKFEIRKKQMGGAFTPMMDSAKANLLEDISWEYILFNNDTGLIYARQFLNLSEKINYKKGLANANNGIGSFLSNTGKYEQALPYFQKALSFGLETGDKEVIVPFYRNLAVTNAKLYKYNEAISYYLMAIRLAEMSGDKTKLADLYQNLGDCYRLSLDNYPLAMEFYQKALAIYQATGNKDGVAGVHFNMGFNCWSQGNFPEALNNALLALKDYEALGDKRGIALSYEVLSQVNDGQHDYPGALANCQNALKIFRQLNDSTHIEFNYGNTGKAYLYLGNYAEALKNELISLTWAKQINDTAWIATTSIYLGNIYSSKKLYAEATKNYLTAIKIFERKGEKHGLARAEIGLGAVYEKQGNLQAALQSESKGLLLAKNIEASENIKDAYAELTVINAKLGNYKAAYDDEVLFKQYYDTIYNKENEKKLTSLQLQYEFNKQQDSIKSEQLKKDVISQHKLQQQKAFTGAGVAAFILVMLLLFFVYRNYTNQRKATAEMAIARTRAEQSEKFKEQFLANMSHEIRTPMNAVLGMTNLVLDTSLNEKQKNYLGAVKKSSENLLVILNDILDLSKLEAGKMELEKVPFNLREQIVHAMDIMRFKAEEKGLIFTAEIADNLPAVVVGDAPRLNQILINLLGNAIKFTDRGFVKLLVETLPMAIGIASPPRIKFEIKDSGIGMTAEQQKKIFKSFTQAEINTSRKYGGTGLGLSISKTLVELHGGNIEVISEPGKGSEFSFIIPCQAGDAKDITAAVKILETDYSSLAKLKLLVAEDNEFNQIVIKDTLENLLPGISVDIAANGKIAVDKLQRGNFDIVLMDVHMPEMDGYEATRYIRNELNLTVPIVALTASVIRSDLDKCMEAGMNGYIPKPFKREQLLKELMKQSQFNLRT